MSLNYLFEQNYTENL